MSDFAQNFIQGVQAGQSRAKAQKDYEIAAEERDLKKQILKHQMDRLKIEDQLHARELTVKEAGIPQMGVPTDTAGLAGSPIMGPPNPDPVARGEARDVTLPAVDGMVPASSMRVPTIQGTKIDLQEAFDRKAAADEAKSKVWVPANDPSGLPPGPIDREIYTAVVQGKNLDSRLEFQSEQTDKRIASSERNVAAQIAAAEKRDREKNSAGGFGGPSSPAAVTPEAVAAGDQFLATLAPGPAATVKALAEGRQPFPTGAALRSPYWVSAIQAVQQYDPSFDAADYNARNRARIAFTTGKQAEGIRGLNQLISHMDKLSENIDKMDNFGVTPANTVANWFSQKSGSPKVTNFNVTKKAVVDEAVKLWRNTGGSEADIKAQLENLDAANSPTQLHGAVNEIAGLLEGAISEYDNQKRNAMGRFHEQLPVLTPQSREILNRLEAKVGSTPQMQQPPQRLPAPPGAATKRFDPATGTIH